MPNLGVNIAIVDTGRILLTRREDFEIWCLPGGGVDDGESVAQAAVREAREETGLDVVLTRLVGIYSRPTWQASGSHEVLFAAKPVGGKLRPQQSEVLDARYFDPHHLPKPLVWWHRQRILDAVNGIGGSVAWSQDVVWPFDEKLTRRELYELRDRSGLSRQEFYERYFDHPGPDGERLELG